MPKKRIQRKRNETISTSTASNNVSGAAQLLLDVKEGSSQDVTPIFTDTTNNDKVEANITTMKKNIHSSDKDFQLSVNTTIQGADGSEENKTSSESNLEQKTVHKPSSKEHTQVLKDKSVVDSGKQVQDYFVIPATMMNQRRLRSNGALSTLQSIQDHYLQVFVHLHSYLNKEKAFKFPKVLLTFQSPH